MNKRLFWTGLGMQGTHLAILMIIGLSLIQWNMKVLLGIFYIVFNIASLIFIFVGAVMKEKDEDKKCVKEIPEVNIAKKK